MIRSIILLYILLMLFSCNTKKKYAGYKETVATIVSYGKNKSTNPLIVSLFDGGINNHNHITWANYSFSVKRKLNEYSVDEGEKNPYYDFNMYGEAIIGEIGEKFIVKYDPKEFDNDHNFLVYYQPIFLENEKTKETKGKIVNILGKDKINGGGIAITFEYCIDTLILNQRDSVNSSYLKYQYLAPETNINTLEANKNKEYKVLYSPENPNRAILYLSN